MSDTPINSAADLRHALADAIRRYVQHLDFEANTELVTVRVEASGAGLTLVYAEHGDGPPFLQVSLNSFGETIGQPPPAPEPERKGFLR